MRLFSLEAASLILKALQEFEQNILGDLTPSSFQVSKPRKAKVSIQIMSRRVERPAELLRHVAAKSP